MTLETVTYDLPSYWASYFVNGDATGLDDKEQQAADDWWSATFGDDQVSCCDVAEESWFTKYHDASQHALAGDVTTFTFLIASNSK